MHFLGRQLLAAAAFAGDQHRRVDRGDLGDVGAQARDGGGVAVDAAGVVATEVVAPVLGRALAEDGHAMRMPERMLEAQHVHRARMEIEEVGGDQVAQGRLFQPVRVEHADPAHAVVAAQEALGVFVLQAVAAVEQQAYCVMLLQQDLARFGQAVHHAHIPSAQFAVAAAGARAIIVGNA